MLIIFPDLLNAPFATSSNLIALLEKASYKTFTYLLITSNILKIF